METAGELRPVAGNSEVGEWILGVGWHSEPTPGGVRVDLCSRAGGDTALQNGIGLSPSIAAKRQRGAEALPCQSSNNSTETVSKLTPYQRKNAYSISENLDAAIQKHGLEKVGFLTLTFPKNLSLRDANRRFNSLATHFLDLHFDSWVCVREFTKTGRPHFHLVVICREDIRTGFDFESYLKMMRMSSTSGGRHKNSKEIKRLSRSLNPSPTLRCIWKELHRVLPLYQFGRHELIPIRKTGVALARYVGGYIRKSMEFRPVEHKGARLISYSKSFPRKVVGHAWSFHCEGSELWRMKVSIFAKLHRVKDLDQMASRYGGRWAWWLRDVIQSINLLPFLPSNRILAYMDTVDALAFNARLAAVGSSERVELQSLHLYRPSLPKVPNIESLNPPAFLRTVFAFHFSSWDLTLLQIDERSDSDRRRLKALRESGRTNFTHETLQAARDKVLFKHPIAYRGGQIERAENWRRLVHPSRPESVPDVSDAWRWGPVIGTSHLC